MWSVYYESDNKFDPDALPLSLNSFRIMCCSSLLRVSPLLHWMWHGRSTQAWVGCSQWNECISHINMFVLIHVLIKPFLMVCFSLLLIHNEENYLLFALNHVLIFAFNCEFKLLSHKYRQCRAKVNNNGFRIDGFMQCIVDVQLEVWSPVFCLTRSVFQLVQPPSTSADLRSVVFSNRYSLLSYRI